MKLSNLVMMGAIATLLLTPIAAQAQRGQGGGGQGRQGGQRGGMMQMGGGQNNLQVLQRADVQADIKLSADQKAALTKIQEEQRAAMQARMQEMRGGGGGGGFDMEAMRAEFEKAQKEQDAAIDKVITAEQKARLKQISFQMRGSRVLLDKEVQKELGLEKDQIRKIEDLQAAQQQANQEAFQRVQSGEVDRTEIQAIMEKNNKALDAELMKIPTDAQKAKLKEMQGPEFKRDPKVDEAMRQNRGGRGGGGGGL